MQNVISQIVRYRKKCTDNTQNFTLKAIQICDYVLTQVKKKQRKTHHAYKQTVVIRKVVRVARHSSHAGPRHSGQMLARWVSRLSGYCSYGCSFTCELNFSSDWRWKADRLWIIMSVCVLLCCRARGNNFFNEGRGSRSTVEFYQVTRYVVFLHPDPWNRAILTFIRAALHALFARLIPCAVLVPMTIAKPTLFSALNLHEWQFCEHVKHIVVKVWRFCDWSGHSGCWCVSGLPASYLYGKRWWLITRSWRFIVTLCSFFCSFFFSKVNFLILMSSTQKHMVRLVTWRPGKSHFRDQADNMSNYRVTEIDICGELWSFLTIF